MNILAIDQARNGAWSIYDYESKILKAYDSFSFPTEKYTFSKAMVEICELVKDLISTYKISVVFIEDIQLRKNVDSFKKLAQLQGSLISMLERNNYLYDFIPPSRWQGYCGARGRTAKEIKAKSTETTTSSGKKASKALSIQFVKSKFGIETENDNLADAICIGYFVCQNVTIKVIDSPKHKNAPAPYCYTVQEWPAITYEQ